MTTPPNKSTVDDVSDVFKYAAKLHDESTAVLGDLRVVLASDYLAAEARAVAAEKKLERYEAPAGMQVGMRKDYQVHNDNVRLQAQVQAAEARAAEYKNTAEAAIDAHQRALAQVDALTRTLKLQQNAQAFEIECAVKAATARCERYEKALRDILQRCHSGIEPIAEAIAEQALATDSGGTEHG